jgi:CheY-like chemotaxis protein
MTIDPRSILIVDDDRPLREALAAMLQDRDYRPTVAEEPEKALELFQGRSFAVALIDLRLGETGGLDIIRDIRTFSPLTQCIVLTGFASKESAIEAINLGAYSYLQKPCDMEQLLLTVRRAGEQVETRQALSRERADQVRRVEARTRRLTAASREMDQTLRRKDRLLLLLAEALRPAAARLRAQTDTLRENAAGRATPECHAALDGLGNEIRRLDRLAAELRDLGRLETGALKPAPSAVSVADICRECRDRIEGLGIDGPTVRPAFSGGVDALWTDGRLLSRILAPLLEGAVRRSPAEGTVTLGVHREGNHVGFTVADTGPALSEKAIARLRSLDLSDREGAAAPSPLDLRFFMVWRLAALLEGTLSVESRAGEGNRFVLLLPFRTGPPSDVAPAEPVRDPEGASAEAGRPRILLAEDNAETAAAVSDFLRSKGYAVRVAGHGREALELARSEPPALILMDVQMPDMDGLEAIRQIRADENLRFIPVIALTALAMAGDRERCLSAGANRYMSKPLRLRALKQAVADFLSPAPETP